MSEFLATIEQLSKDKLHGSSWLLERIITAFLEHDYDTQELQHAFHHLQQIDKNMMVIHHFLTTLGTATGSGFKSKVHAYHHHWANLPKTIAAELRQFINHEFVALTHSHSYMVLQVIEELSRLKYAIKVIQTRSEPGGEGVIQARALEKAGIPVTLISDDSVSAKMNDLDYCFLGVDHYDEHYFINKTGTGNIVNLAQQYGKSVFILGDPRKKVSRVTNKPFGVFERVPFDKNIRLLTGTKG